jgi:hypothetical protein
VGILASIQNKKAPIVGCPLPLVPPKSAVGLVSTIAQFLDLVMLTYNVFFKDSLTTWEIVFWVFTTWELILLCSSMGKRTII